MSLIELLAHEPRVIEATRSFKSDRQAIVDLAISIQQIAAPTFSEEHRAAWVEETFRSSTQATDISRDELQNVYGCLPGQRGSHSPPLIVTAHTDTVFPVDTDLTVKHKNGYVYGPGIADNSAGVAGLIWLLQTLERFNLRSYDRDIWFVANIAEEGLGDLKGMRRVVERFGSEATYIVIEGGSYGHIIHQGIGVKRYRVRVSARGGHSWADFGQSSAIHTLGQLIAAIDRLSVPKHPKTTYNVGVIEGGTSINTIAEEAHLLLDLRSEDPDALKKLVADVHQIIHGIEKRKDISVTLEKIGDRPAGHIEKDTELIQWATDALKLQGNNHIEYGASSTDANIPLSVQAPAVCIGLAHSGNIHRLSEYLDPTYLPQGMGQLLLLTLAAAQFSQS